MNLLYSHIRALVRIWTLRNQLQRAEEEVTELRTRLLASTLRPLHEPLMYSGTDADHMPLISYFPLNDRQVPPA